MSIFDSIILGIVEGVTEFLPISSTGHLILVSKLMALPATDFLKSFEIAIQLGAIFSVVALYWRRFLVDRDSLKKILAAFLPTAVLGFVFYGFIKKFLLDNEVVVLISLFVGGLLIIIFEKTNRGENNSVGGVEEITFRQSLLIGLFQSVAMIPGVSRAAATIIGGLFLGLRREAVVEFSFLLAVPTMAAATGLDLLKSFSGFSVEEVGVLSVGFLVSFVVAMLSIKFLLKFIKNHNFTAFGIYRIIFSIILFFVFFN